MKITIERRWNKPSYCIGRLYINGKYLCDTIEDTDRGINNLMSEKEILAKKVYGETAIPRGAYEVVMTYSPKFHNRSWAKITAGKVPQIMNVPCWSGVRIHPGNSAADLLGCIAPGKNTIKGGVTSSTHWYQVLVLDYIMPAVTRNEKIIIEIV